mgnify:CR=1 FL=1
MLANGAKLGYKKKSEASSAYKDLPGLKEIPELGSEPEKVENTTLTDPHKMYELGIGDLPDMVYKYKYDNTKADSPYRVMRQAEWEILPKAVSLFCEGRIKINGNKTEII